MLEYIGDNEWASETTKCLFFPIASVTTQRNDVLLHPDAVQTNKQPDIL